MVYLLVVTSAREFSLRSISKGPYFLRQHLATQMHKTNTLIAHSRESDVLLELSELHSQIKTKFPNIFILKKSSAFCQACKTHMSLLGRNVMGIWYSTFWSSAECWER